MNLRPHHLLCIQKFTGHGYDEAFTQHMTAIVAELTDKPGTQIRITQGCDDLCGKCPHNVSGVCTSLEKVTFMDNRVMSICELSYGDKIPWSKIAEKAYKRVFETDEFNHICGYCQWFELCKETEIDYESYRK